MTQDHQNSSKHYVQMMAIKDRVNCEAFPDGKPIGDLRDVPNSEFLPTAEENVSMRQDIIKITAEILCSHLDCFKDFQGIIDSKFQHKYSDEMKKKSYVVPLGILPLNENKTSDMIEILKTLHKYVPGSRSEEEINCEDERDDSCAGMRTIPLGGDQLTVERIRSAHLCRFDGDTPEERLEGVIAMVEDFHEKMNFLQVIMDRYYSTNSSRERGTLYQLRNIINRRNVVSDVSKGYHASADFIDLVTECHIITAALEHLNMESPSSECESLPENISKADSETKKAILLQICTAIVDKYFLNDVSQSLNKIETGDQSTASSEDKVFNYASNFTKLGIIRKVAVKST
ncbi:unnamed protein product [Mytilus coruscus]|uniref:DUF6589 domain-containing protein n=1 Tax=Mytilus coruscus TaxID=42192 RepID=A0A6J8DHH4_MYTCO|nr:unnamed protein product [Mytilus coruscus]